MLREVLLRAAGVGRWHRPRGREGGGYVGLCSRGECPSCESCWGRLEGHCGGVAGDGGGAVVGCGGMVREFDGLAGGALYLFAQAHVLARGAVRISGTEWSGG